MSMNGEWFDGLDINKAIYLREGEANNHKRYNDLDSTTAAVCKMYQDDAGLFHPVAFTPHDFERHIKTVLRNGSRLLSKSLSMKLFTIDDLLSFQYACLLHDIDMLYNPYGRATHSAAGTMILDEYSEENIKKAIKDLRYSITEMGDSVSGTTETNEELIKQVDKVLQDIMRFQIADDSHRRAAAMIILGHSDIKLNDGNRIDTLNKAFYPDISKIIGSQSGESIKTRVLAAVLRLADELDCTCLRRNGVKEIQIKKFPEEAQKYWDRLLLFSDVKIEVPSVTLVVDCTFFSRIKTERERKKNFEWLKEVYDKTEQERSALMKCFAEENIIWGINKIILHFEDKKLEKEYYAFCDDLKKKKSVNISPLDVNGLKGYIRKTIENNKLYCEVHDRKNDKGIRNYLDCNGLLTDVGVLDGITRAFINHIYTKTFDQFPDKITQDEYILVGVANSGALLASRIALITGLPMIFYVPELKKQNFSERETQWLNYSEKYRNRKAILIIGASVTGIAIEEACEFLQKVIGDTNSVVKIEAILGVINRDENNKKLQKMKEKGICVDFLLNEYPVDWCKYNDSTESCPYKYQCKRRRGK